MPLDLPTRPAKHPLRDRGRLRSAPQGIRHGRLKRSNPFATLAKLIGGTLAVVLISTLALSAYAVITTVNTVKPGIHLATLPVTSRNRAAATPAAPTSMDGAYNILLAGTDTRTGQGGQFSSADELAGSSGAGNNDVTMVLHVSADHKSATVISIPRDLVVPIPDCPGQNGGVISGSTGDMFNTTLSRGGLSCVVLTAEQLTGLNIPYAAEISFDGVIAMSNAVGGVQVCLATPLKDPYVGLDLPSGQQTLVGAQALAYLRSRHGVGDGSDLGRISDQQLFLSSLMRKLTSAGVLGNPITLYSLAHAALSNMTLSDTLTQPATMVSMALALKSIKLSDMVFLQYPAVTDPDNAARVIPDASAVTILKAALQTNQPLRLTGGTGVATESSTPTPSPTPAAVAPTPASGAPGTLASAAPVTGAPAPTHTTTSVALPSNVTGQTADQQTCTKGN